MSDSGHDNYPSADMTDLVHLLKSGGDEFAVATVVRTISVTAAKPGAKAIINASGEILEGWIGGGCARHAVITAAKKSIADGEPRFVSIQPEEILKERGLHAGEERDGVTIASNLCPSKGSMEIFVEPVLSSPDLLVLGASPVAAMLVRLGGSFGFNVSVIDTNLPDYPAELVKNHYTQASEIPKDHPHRYTVVATQGSGDVDALLAVLALQSRYIGFVGSRRKLLFLKEKLKTQGLSDNSLQHIKGPAGLDIGGVTPQEIALSILAEIIQLRRRKLPTSA
ncbi:hypothetical protein AB833_05540 [Chromatiales bacterium (ex Bugula neritina AB1)]|nr:hypothetical protein AB833_05540 [Chromatiales bacterium (ex Bugula neritina AB1)]